MNVRPKKHLGQHFLKDLGIARKIADLLPPSSRPYLEIGPGTGVLTQYLLQRPDSSGWFVDVDEESVQYLKAHYPQHAERFLLADYLNDPLPFLQNEEAYDIIGNFPYNISSQIFFRALQDRHRVRTIVCMLQREVAQRLASPPGSKEYGILSVLLQAWYTIRYEFTVSETVFNPPPKVKSGVISLHRNEVQHLACDEKAFVRVVKQGFNNRRKTLRNALKPLLLPGFDSSHPLFDKRAEQLSVSDFVELTLLLYPQP